MKRLLASLILAACPTTSVAGQASQEEYVLQVNSELVVRTVSVTSANGRPIEGLKPEDFTVTEGGIPQTIRVFEFHAIDNTPLGERAADTATATNAVTIGEARPNVMQGESSGEEFAYADRRLLALYFDLAGMSQPEQIRTFEAVMGFVTSGMTSADLVAILTYSDGTVSVVQEFTDDQTRLLATLQALRDGRDTTPGSLAPASAQGSTAFDIFATARRLSALKSTAETLGRLTEAKALVYFSSGVTIGTDNQAQLRATVNAAVRSNVAIYPVDSRGLTASAPLGNAATSSPGGITAYTTASATNRINLFQRSQDVLYTLAADTGGSAILDSNDPASGIVEAQQANSGYYVLGYYPSDVSQDGGLRQIKIELQGRSGTLIYRNSYYADKDFSQYSADDKERQLEEALLLGNPITDLTMAVEPNYFKVNESDYFVPVAVRIPGEELVRAQRAGAADTVIDFVGEIRDQTGRLVRSLRDQVKANLGEDDEAHLASRLIQYDTGFILQAGTFSLKLLARNADTGRIGTYQGALVIPDLAHQLSLPISSVVLSSQQVAVDSAVFNADENQPGEVRALNPLVRDGRKLIPRVSRVFSRTQPLYVYLEAYKPNAVNTASLAAVVTLYENGTRALRTQVFEVQGADRDDQRVVPVALTVGLDQLSPGEYTCQITILDPDAQEFTFWQSHLMITP